MPHGKGYKRAPEAHRNKKLVRVNRGKVRREPAGPVSPTDKNRQASPR